MNITFIASALPRADKDARRIALFTAAIAVKTADLATTHPAQLQSFSLAAARLVQDWIPSKGKLLAGIFGAPFRDARDRFGRALKRAMR